MKKTLTILFVCVIIVGAITIPISATETEAENGIVNFAETVEPYPLYNTYTNFNRAWVVGGTYYNIPIKNTFSINNQYNIGYSVTEPMQTIYDDLITVNENEPISNSMMTFYDMYEDIQSITLFSDYMILDEQLQEDIQIEIEAYGETFIENVILEFDVMKVNLSVMSHASYYEFSQSTVFETVTESYNLLADETNYLDWITGLDNIYNDLLSRPEFEGETAFFCTNVRLTVTFNDGDGNGASMVDMIIHEPISSRTRNPNDTISGLEDEIIFAEKNFVTGDIDFLGWISSQVDALLNIKILPTITIGAILWAVVALAFLCWMLKIFLGG